MSGSKKIFSRPKRRDVRNRNVNKEEVVEVEEEEEEDEGAIGADWAMGAEGSYGG